MNQLTTLCLPQKEETPLEKKQQRHFTYRYAYFRSFESGEFAESGQDYLVIREDERRVAFSLCDGVGRSFQGDLAARLLGDELVDWLWNQLPSANEQAASVENELKERLHNLISKASEEVNNICLPQELPPLHREALEQQRTQGSESMFVAGLIDINLKRLTLVWMGDSRLRLWGPNGERSQELGTKFLTKERWSSHRGPIGQVHAFVTPLEGIRCLVAYSDGFALLDKHSECPPDDDQVLKNLIDEARNTPPDDDLAFLEITLAPTPKPSPKSLPVPSQFDVKWQTDQLCVSWQSIPGASHYELEVLNGQIPTWRVSQSEQKLSKEQLPTGARVLRVRAWAEDKPGSWSSMIDIPVANHSNQWLIIVLRLSVVLSLIMATFFFGSDGLSWLKEIGLGTIATQSPVTLIASSTPTGTPTATANATVTPTVTASATVASSATASATVAPTVIASATVAPSATASAIATFTPSPSATLTPSPTTTPVLEGIVTASSLNVRAGPGTNYDYVGDLSNGEHITLLGHNSGWYKITIKGQEQNGNEVIVEGWVEESWLNVADETAKQVPEVPAP